MRKIPDAYTAISEIVLPYMRNYAEIHIFFSHSAMIYLNVTMRKIAGAYASTCGFPQYSSYGAILLFQDNYTFLCGKITYIC